MASGQTRSQRALERALGCGCLLLAIGSIGLVFFAGKSGALPMLCVFLVKAVGPPLTIAVLVLLAKLPFDVASKTAALSMALAFLIEIMLRLAFASASAGEGVALLLGATCQIAGCLGALCFDASLRSVGGIKRGGRAFACAVKCADAPFCLMWDASAAHVGADDGTFFARYRCHIPHVGLCANGRFFEGSRRSRGGARGALSL